MADYAPVQESELETGPQAPGGLVGNGTGDLSKYEPVNDNDMAPPMPPQRGIKGMPSYSPAVMARLQNGDPVTRTIGKAAQGFATGFGDAYTSITAEEADNMRKAGFRDLAPGEAGTVAGTLRFFGQALVSDAARVKAGVMALWSGALGATQEGVTQAATEAGAANPKEIGQEAAGALQIMGTDASIATMLMSRSQYAEATRIVPNPSRPGAVMDQRIGPVPDHVEAAQQAATVATHYGIPDAAPAITEAYNKGVLPAEIFYDAKSDATILPALVEGKVPEAYPVQDWTGAEISPEGGVKGGNAALAASGVESPRSPSAPIPASKLPAGAPRPVAGTGEVKTLGLSESTEAAAINKDLSEGFGELPTYQAVKDTDQGAMATKFLNDDPEAAMEVAMGTKAAPKGLLPEAAYVAVKNRAVAEGDVETIRNLATQSNLAVQAKTMGQRISYLRNVNPENDPVAAIQQVQEARAAALKAKGVDVAANTNQAAAEYAPLRAAARAPKGADAWQKFMTSIRCAE